MSSNKASLSAFVVAAGACLLTSSGLAGTITETDRTTLLADLGAGLAGLGFARRRKMS